MGFSAHRTIQFLFFFSVFLIAFQAKASSYAGQITIKSFYVDEYDGKSYVMFGSGQALPSDTCNFWARAWKFDPTTPHGEAIYKALLSARMSGATVNLWYWPSTKPGTDHTSGCGHQDMATVHGIGFTE